MRAGISTASLFMRKNNEEALPLLNELGVTLAEVFLTSFSEYGYPFAELLSAKKGNLTVNSVHDLNTEFDPQLSQNRFALGAFESFSCAVYPARAKSQGVRRQQHIFHYQTAVVNAGRHAFIR